MKEVLLINLKRNGDIFTTGHVIRSILKKDPTTRISFLVLKEFERAAQALKGIHQIYTIDRKKVLTFSKNRIFSDGFALDQLNSDLSKVILKSWDTVFNYSNDRVSTHITSLLQSRTSKHVGIRFNDYCNVEYSNEWAIVFNDILPEVKYAPVNFIDTYHRQLSVEKDTDGFVLSTKEEYNQAAFKNFSEIRKDESSNKDIKIVGLQVCASSEEKMLPHEELISLIDALYMDPEYFPVILVAPTDEERHIANTINGEFNNSLVSIESDFTAMNSVLMNLDLLITPDTAVKHQADLAGTPTIEISLAEGPIFKQGITNEDSLIITPNVSIREFSKSQVQQCNKLRNQNELMRFEDIFALVQYLLKGQSLENHTFSRDISIYRPTQDIMGTYYRYFAGECDQEAELERSASRQLLSKKLLNDESKEVYDFIKTLNHSHVTEWLTSSKDKITEISKDLLATLRSIIQVEGNQRAFVKNLTKLCIHCEDESQFMKIPSLRFRSRLEGITSENIIESSREIESLLYELKSDIQIQVDIVKSIQELMRNQKDNARAQKSLRDSSKGISNGY